MSEAVHRGAPLHPVHRTGMSQTRDQSFTRSDGNCPKIIKCLKFWVTQILWNTQVLLEFTHHGLLVQASLIGLRYVSAILCYTPPCWTPNAETVQDPTRSNHIPTWDLTDGKFRMLTWSERRTIVLKLQLEMHWIRVSSALVLHPACSY